MNPDIQMQMRVSELMLEKVVLDTKIQRAVLASQRLTHHDEDLSEMIDDLLSKRQLSQNSRLVGEKSVRPPLGSSPKVAVVRIPGWFEKTMFKLFSGRS
jgi:hypothetical protein